MIDAAISVRALTKIFPLPLRRRQLVAIRDLNLEVAPGEVHGLLGPNGSGKSTTLKIILGLVSPTKGRTQIFGRDSRDVGSRAAVGFLPENPYFYKYLTGEETLIFFGKLCGLRSRRLRARAGELLALVRLEKARDQRLGSYSKGMLQRIGLAQALLSEPKLIVLDEPTAAVDPEGSREICDLILKLKKSGITVLLSSHLLGQVQEICDRVSILSRGVLVRRGRVEDLVAVHNRTELVVENATQETLAKIRCLLERSGTRLVEQRQSRTSLERLFLDATRRQRSD